MVSLMAMFELYRAKPSPGKFSWFRPVLFLGELFNHMIKRIEARIVVNSNLEPWIVECTCQKGGEKVWCSNPEANNGCNDSNHPNCISGKCGKHGIRSII